MIVVAGGRGEIAFQFQTLRGIPTTVIDPRPGSGPAASNASWQPSGPVSIRQPHIDATSSTLDNPLNKASTSVGLPSVGTPVGSDKTVEDGVLPSPIKVSEGLGLPCFLASGATSSAAVDEGEKSLGLFDMASPGACGEKLRGKLLEHLCCEFAPALWDGPLGKHPGSCSLVLGLHPDQVRYLITIA